MGSGFNGNAPLFADMVLVLVISSGLRLFGKVTTEPGAHCVHNIYALQQDQE